MPSRPSSPKPRASWQTSFKATGTTWTIEVYDQLSDTQCVELEQAVRERVEAFEQTYSRFRPDSLTSQLAARGGTYDIPADMPAMLDLYRELYDITHGQLTPLIGQTLVDAGYDPTYSLQPKDTITQPPAWEDVIEYDANGRTLTMKQAAQLDFGAIGKGYLVDIVAELLNAHAVRAFCVDAGGDMVVSGTAGPLEVGLENPDLNKSGEVIGVVSLHNAALCGSSGNRRRWSTYHHVISPTQLVSPEHIQAIWVVAPTAILADGLATALYFVPAATLKKQYTFEYILVLSDGTAEVSPDIPGRLFT